jgi:uncharacterized damage-inducible protein DinB
MRMTHTEALLAELTREAEATRRLLERVPEDRLDWAPHLKSMSLGQLALHVAGLTAGVAELIDPPSAEVPTVPLPVASSVAEILATLDESVPVAAERIAAWGDEGLRATWTLTQAGTPVLQLSRGEMVRSILLNHWYHHRGQLTVYLRLLGVALPQIYGPTADEAA